MAHVRNAPLSETAEPEGYNGGKERSSPMGERRIGKYFSSLLIPRN